MAGSRSTSQSSDTTETEAKPKGIHDSAPKNKTVGSYDERPYGEAITAEHRAVLAEHGVEVKKSDTTVEAPTA